MQQNLINHVALVLDASASMRGVSTQAVQAADALVKFLARRSEELSQETRVTVYTFSNVETCHFYDMDVLRLPSMKDLYRLGSNTALIGASLKAITDLEQTATLYGDHAFLAYILTDGEENASTAKAVAAFPHKVKELPENWTIAALVPNQRGVRYAQGCGFAEGNIAVWETNADGMEAVGSKIRQATNAFMENRALGIRGTRNLFQVNTQNVVVGALQELSKDKYQVYFVGTGEGRDIRDFVSQETGRAYKAGNAYYQLMKKEEIQAHKDIAVMELATGKLFIGNGARRMIGLPDKGIACDAVPDASMKYQIFVQSTSYNRKMTPNTMMVVMN